MKTTVAVAVLINQVSCQKNEVHQQTRNPMCQEYPQLYLQKESCAWACEGIWYQRNQYMCEQGLSSYSCENKDTFAAHTKQCKEALKPAEFKAMEFRGQKEREAFNKLESYTKQHGTKEMKGLMNKYEHISSSIHHIEKQKENVHHLRREAKKHDHDVKFENKKAEPFIKKAMEWENKADHYKHHTKMMYEYLEYKQNQKRLDRMEHGTKQQVARNQYMINSLQGRMPQGDYLHQILVIGKPYENYKHEADKEFHNAKKYLSIAEQDLLDAHRERIHADFEQHHLDWEQHGHRHEVRRLEREEHHVERKWKKEVGNAQKESGTEAVQIDDDTESNFTSVGTSAVVITGLVIGASCFMYNKKRQTQKSGLESSLIDQEE